MDRTRYPVYIIAHNPNTLAEADEALALGVNALEPDVQYNSYTKDLCISHDVPGRSDEPLTVEAYLEHVKSRLAQYPGLSLILFDIKLDEPAYHGVSVADWGTRLHQTANRILKDTGLAILYSVSKIAQLGVFTDFALLLGAKEGIMVDQETAVEEMIGALQPLIAEGVQRIVYADGSYAYVTGLGIAENVRNAIKRRAREGSPQLVTTWVLPNEKSVELYFRMGVDGMIVTNGCIKTALEVVKRPEFAGRLRLAERNDNPFTNGLLNYGIEIRTADKKLAGTDALITCTLSGPEHSVTFYIEAGYPGAFEKGSTTLATIKMPDAGTPLSVSLSHNGSGISAEWLPESVRVFELATGLDVAADLGKWLKAGEICRTELRQAFKEKDATAQQPMAGH